MILRHAACDLRAYRRAPLRLGGGYSLSVHWSNSSMSLRCRFSTLTARSWPGTDPMRRAGGSMRFPALVPRSPPLWSPASLIRRLSDLDGIFPPGLGWCRSNIRAGARTSSAASANRADRYLRGLFTAGALAVIRYAKDPVRPNQGPEHRLYRGISDGGRERSSTQ